MAEVATSFGVLNYSRMLFNKGNTRTPSRPLRGEWIEIYILARLLYSRPRLAPCGASGLK